MSLRRVVARLDIKGQNLIKGIHLEGLRVVGDPHEYALRYAKAGMELLYIDTVASLYGRNQLLNLLEKTTEGVFVPITVGGGIRTLGDVRTLLRAGADAVAVNTSAINNPRLIQEIADTCGSQAITVSIEAKRVPGGWEAFTNNGRERTGRDAIEWAHEAVSLGAGELLITSIDQEGTQRGFDIDLIKAIEVPVPVVASGGMGKREHMEQALEAGADAVAIAHMLHYGKISVEELMSNDIPCEIEL